MIEINWHEWGWPQWIMIFFMALALLPHAIKHGHERVSTYDISGAVIGVLIQIIILSAGGFFK